MLTVAAEMVEPTRTLGAGTDTGAGTTAGDVDAALLNVGAGTDTVAVTVEALMLAF